MLILYTKNIELTTYHTQKAVQYYVEFICQIGEGNNNYISLTSRDAVLFVYKKTIFEINQDYRNERLNKENEDTTAIVTMLTTFIQFYNSMLIYTVEHNSVKIIELSTRDHMKKLIYTHLYKIIEQLIQIPLHFNNEFSSIRKILNDIESISSVLISYCNLNIKSNIIIISVEYIVKRATCKSNSQISDTSIIIDEDTVKEIKNKLIHIDHSVISTVNASYIRFLKFLNLYNIKFAV